MKQRQQLLIGITISIIFLVVFLRNTDFSQVATALTSADIRLVLAAILIYFLGVWFRALRWKYLIKPLTDVGHRTLFPLVTIGLMVNDILPGRLGIVARSYIVGEKKNISKLASGATVITENVLDGLALILILLVGIFLIPTPSIIKTIGGIAAVLFVSVFSIMLMVTYSEKKAQLVIRLVMSVAPDKWRLRISNWINLFIDGLEILRSPGELIRIFLLSLVVWVCESTTFFLVALSLDLVVSFHAMLLVMAITSLSWTLVLVSPGGIGTFDTICKFILIEALGVTGGLATAFTVAIHAVLFIPVIVLGFIFLWRENLSLREVTKS